MSVRETSDGLRAANGTRAGRAAALFRYFVLGALALLLLLMACVSARWRMEHDTPLLNYAAYLMNEHGRFPYRDIFETSMPGAFAFHSVVTRLFGYGDAAFRFVDLALLSLLLAATYVFMRRFGRAAGIASSIAFGLIYLTRGQTMSLQRDYVGVIPVACSLLCIPRETGQGVRLPRFVVAGLLFGVSATIKPHLAVGLPVVFGTLLTLRWDGRQKSWSDFFRCAAACGLAFLLPALLALFWLWRNSALSGFASLFFDYLPLHVALTGSQAEVYGLERVLYLFEHTIRFGGYGALVVCSLFGCYVAASRRAATRETTHSLAAVALCALAYTVYPALGGKFWDYHFVPLAYFLSLACGLCLSDAPPEERRAGVAGLLRGVAPVLAFFVAVSWQAEVPRHYVYALNGLRHGSAGAPPKGGRVDEIAGWLKTHAAPTDAVQPLDWANGAAHAMLIARARLATEFMYDYHFYHHTSSPVVRDLRRRFLRQLDETAPRFVVEVKADKPWLPAPSAPGGFPELTSYVETNYEIVKDGGDYVIYERRPR